MIRRLIAIAILIVGVSMVAVTGVWPSDHRPVVVAAGPGLNGGGSSFAKNEIDQWRAEVARKPFELSINYVAQGSSFGRQQYIAGTLDFAASDIPFTSSELNALNNTNRKDYVYVPVSAGGLGFMYNLIDKNGQQVRNLNLTREAVCQIFTKPGMKWSDPEIAAPNPGLALPDELVRPIVRSDGSGTSFVLSEFCIAVAKNTWDSFRTRQQADPSLDPTFVAGGPTSNWPVNWGVVGSALAADGVAAAVADSSGRYAITYNEAGFAKLRNFPNASVQNAAGAFVQPTEDAVSVALSYAQPNGNGTFTLNYTGPAGNAYFPSTYSYVIAQTTGFSPDKGAVLSKFLCYAVTKGQRLELTSKLGYARLSQELVAIARESISKIPGAPPWEQCAVSSEPPPPTPTVGPAITTTTRPGPGTATTLLGGATPTTKAGSRPVTPTSIYIDPITGSSIAVIVDPITGSTVLAPLVDCDPTIDPGCTPNVPADGDQPSTSLFGQFAPGGTPGAGGSSVSNPAVVSDPPAPDAAKIAWWLVQGAAVCALGVALAGARRRPA